MESTAYAQVAAVEAIKLPAIVQCDHLLAIPAIQHLEQTHTLLYTLLKLFAEDSLEAFYKFHKVNGGFLASAGIISLFLALSPFYIYLASASMLKL